MLLTTAPCTPLPPQCGQHRERCSLDQDDLLSSNGREQDANSPKSWSEFGNHSWVLYILATVTFLKGAPKGCYLSALPLTL
jgi:hypothetical protein